MIGSWLGTYQIIEEVGKGGMATVYRAYQPSVDRDVALKVIRKSITDDMNAMQRFEREARLIARLEHPHILPVYDFNGEHDPPYIVMRFLDSGTLKHVLAQKRLPLDEILYLIQQITSALHYAHRAGVIHRDVKPSNIMVDGDGNAFVTDLGIARIASFSTNRASEDPITATGAIVGTPEYMSPEQALGREIDHRADIYALGVVLFEMLAGRRPFESSSPTSVMIMHVNDPVPAVTSINPDLPPEMDMIIWRSMAKEPVDRYNNAQEMTEALKAAIGTIASSPETIREAIRETKEMQLAPTVHMGNQGEQIDTATQSTPFEQQKHITTLYLNVTEMEEILLDAMNPEIVHWIMESVAMQLQAAVYNHGGMIYEMTDRSMQAIWGIEFAHENDPEQAIRAALEMKAIILPAIRDHLNDSELTPFKIIINTGPALVQPSEAERQYSVTGHTLAVVRRLERSAPPGEVLITYNTYRMVMGMFEVIPLKPLQIRGQKTQMQVFQVKLARPRRLRVRLRDVEGVETKTIGRESEVRRIEDAMLIAIEDGETQVITVTGDMGVGKSRVVYEFRRWLEMQDDKLFILQGRSVQQSMNTPYYLLRDLLSFFFNLYDGDPPDLVRQKLIEGFAMYIGPDTEVMAQVLGLLVGFQFVPEPAANEVIENTAQHYDLRVAYVYRFFKTLSEKRPILVELEDFQWADEQSLDIINKLVTDNAHLRMLVICVARPTLYQRRPSWGEGQPFHSQIELRPLGRRDSRRLVGEILQKVETVPDTLRDQVIERAEGNPFYIEESIKVLLEDGVIVKQSEDMWRIEDRKLTALRVPATLSGLMQSRLDALPYVEQIILQRAGVVGRVFWDASITALERADGVTIPNISMSLDALREREMIYQREESRFPNTREYMFRHKILREVVYANLLESQRREYHLAAGRWLEKASEGRHEEYRERIDEHMAYARGENPI